MTPVVAAAAAVPGVQLVTDRLTDACGTAPGTLCRTVFALTHSSYLANGAEVLLAKPFRIVLVVVIALVVRRVLHRAIDRAVARAGEGIPRWDWADRLDPLRSRAPRLADAVEAVGDVAPLRSDRHRQRAGTVGSLLKNGVSLLVLGIAFVTILGELGINLVPIVASAGIVGVAVGFGAQNLVRDVLTGIFMILEDQYGVGDVVDAGPASGSVEAVGLRTTRLRDVNGVVWHIRNGEITRIGNMSQQWSRALIDVPVAYTADVGTARGVIKDVADGVWQDPDYADMVLEEPEVWGVEQLGPDGLVVRLVVKTVPLQQWVVARELRERIKAGFDAAGLEIPLPQRELWVRRTPRPADRLTAAGDAGGAVPRDG